MIAYFVTQRTPEIGVRVALGATTRDVISLVVWQAARPVLAGVAAGVAGAYFGARVLAAQLVNVPASDPLTFGAVIAARVGVGMLASLIPARRAAAMDPTRALM